MVPGIQEALNKYLMNEWIPVQFRFIDFLPSFNLWRSLWLLILWSISQSPTNHWRWGAWMHLRNMVVCVCVCVCVFIERLLWVSTELHDTGDEKWVRPHPHSEGIHSPTEDTHMNTEWEVVWEGPHRVVSWCVGVIGVGNSSFGRTLTQGPGLGGKQGQTQVACHWTPSLYILPGSVLLGLMLSYLGIYPVILFSRPHFFLNPASNSFNWSRIDIQCQFRVYNTVIPQLYTLCCSHHKCRYLSPCNTITIT